MYKYYTILYTVYCHITVKKIAQLIRKYRNFNLYVFRKVINNTIVKEYWYYNRYTYYTYYITIFFHTTLLTVMIYIMLTFNN